MRFFPAQHFYWNKSSVGIEKRVNCSKLFGIATVKEGIEKMFEDLFEQLGSQTVGLLKRKKPGSPRISIAVDWNVSLYCFEKCKMDLPRRLLHRIDNPK
jgi:hypothetical protein